MTPFLKLNLATAALLLSTSLCATPFCSKQDLSAQGTVDVAAGNIFFTLTLENISKAPCKVIGNNKLVMQYPMAVTNVKTVQTQQPKEAFYILKPQQKIYAAIHVPNGPQCNSALSNPNVMLSYLVAPKVTVVFGNQQANNPFAITTCQSAKDLTTVTLFPFSLKPLP